MARFRSSLFRAALLVLALTALPGATAAQGASPGNWNATRSELTDALARLEQYATSPAYSERARADARLRAQAVRSRLEEGDFREGDAVIVSLTGTVARLDTLTVRAGPRIQVAPYGEIELRGILRSELESQLSTLIRRSVLDASVRVRPLVRLAVFGSVGDPGYLTVPLETRLDELIMRAGGPETDADPADVRVMRGEAVILDGPQVLSAISSGRTIGTLALQEGDYLLLRPRPADWDRAATLQIIGLVATPLLTFFLLRR